eukprot:700174-Prorocentrum_minimum.AAC.1
MGGPRATWRPSGGSPPPARSPPRGPLANRRAGDSAGVWGGRTVVPGCEQHQRHGGVCAGDADGITCDVSRAQGESSGRKWGTEQRVRNGKGSLGGDGKETARAEG